MTELIEAFQRVGDLLGVEGKFLANYGYEQIIEAIQHLQGDIYTLKQCSNYRATMLLAAKKHFKNIALNALLEGEESLPDKKKAAEFLLKNYKERYGLYGYGVDTLRKIAYD